MVANFVLDIETLDIESTAVILSAALLCFELEPTGIPEDADYNCYYDTLVSSCAFVKFSATEQYRTFGRSINKDTMDWWDKCNDEAKRVSLIPQDTDMTAAHGLSIIRDYYLRHKEKHNTIWIRGSLDQVAFDSLARSVGTLPVAPYYVYRDVRTAVDLLAKNAKDGYAELSVPFNKSRVIKHDPRHDCAYEAMQLTFM